MASDSKVAAILKRMLVFCLVLAGAVYLTLAIIAFFFAERLIFQPQPIFAEKDPDILTIPTVSGENITARFYASADAHFTILFSHGNAEDIVSSAQFSERLRDAGFNVLAYDYRGYGWSEGRPGEKNAYEDIDAAYDFLVRDRRIDPSRIIIHGRSLGGAVSVDLASRRKCAGLIAESTFTSAFRVMTGYRILPFDQFESESKIGRVACPVLFIHGDNDALIKPWHSERLFRATTASKEMFVVPGAGHNNVTQKAGDAYFQRIRDFAANLPE